MLRPVEAADEAALARQWNEPAVGRFLWDARPVSPETVRRALADSARTFARHGYGLWAVCRDGRVVGWCGLRPFAHGSGVELLYSLERASWGRRYAAEAAAAVLDDARRRVGLTRVFAAANPQNVASWRVLERVGMRRVGRFRTDLEDLLVYST